MQFHSFTTSVLPNTLYRVPSKKEKLPLSITHPELAKEADGWNPADVQYSDTNLRSWKCKSGHKWDSKPASRTGKGLNVPTISCPVCSGTIPEKGVTDLQTLYPEVSLEAKDWDPFQYFPGSNRKMDWQCKFGHVWKATIYERALRNSGCPYCKNTKVLTGFNDLATLFPDIASQAHDWDPSLVNIGSHKKYNWKCPKNHIWVSTPVHRIRMKQGCAVCDGKQIQIGVNDLKSLHPELALQADGWDPQTISAGSHEKKSWKCKIGHTWKASVGDMASRNHLCPYCSNQNLLSGFNDLATKFPGLAQEADGWDASNIHAGAKTKKSWKCSKGHTWIATINSRTLLNVGCPFCSGAKTWPGFNDLITTDPEIAKEAYGWDASKYSLGSAVKKKWRCTEGHFWTTAINVRKRSGCPTCAKSGFDPNQDSYLYFLKQDSWHMYQIGITNDIERRLKEHSKNNWQVLEVRGPMDGHLTQQWETAILRMLKARGADLSNEKIAGKFDGYSEAWSKSTFDVTSIKELMRLTEEFEADGKA
jgi:hypothetical protein